MLSSVEQRKVFGAKHFLQFVYLLGQLLGFLAVFLLIDLVQLITEIEDLAIGLGFLALSPLMMLTTFCASAFNLAGFG